MNVKIDQSWKNLLSDQWDTDYFGNLVSFVRNQYATRTVYPPAGKIFAAFDSCPVQNVKVVIIGQDPYHGPGQANGLCFSVAPGVPLPPSLVNIFKEISNETGMPPSTDGDLQRWASQGVLLLNATLTVEAHRAGSHQGQGWEIFTDSVISHLSNNCSNLVFLLWGNYACSKQRLIDKNKHLVLTSAHPSPLSAYRGFLGNGHFTTANRYLVEHGKAPVEW